MPTDYRVSGDIRVDVVHVTVASRPGPERVAPLYEALQYLLRLKDPTICFRGRALDLPPLPQRKYRQNYHIHDWFPTGGMIGKVFFVSPLESCSETPDPLHRMA